MRTVCPPWTTSRPAHPVSTALYRKYRPQTFDDVVGQDDVVRTLRNAIEHDQLRQAYLFSGPRGTGKTSLARILARALNCVEGPTATPCGQCESCAPISVGTSLDVIEMDAASQRGIDDVREMRDRALLQPINRFKIYILDEAHQLTKDAFNALLKLIEEPPPHLVFIFCTTELDKMLATVRSRCQTLQFARPSLLDMTKVLRKIADSEEIEAPDAALAQIAQSARGSFRDAISTFDQLAAATGGTVDVPSVLRLLGVVEEDALFRLIDLVVDGDTAGALSFIEELAENGQDIGRVVIDLLEHLRRLLLLQHLEVVPASLPVTDETGARLRSQAGQLGEATILRFFDLLTLAVTEEREGGDPRLPLELALVRITKPASDGSPDALRVRLERVERLIDRPAVSGVAASAPPPQAKADSSASARPAEGAPPTGSSEPAGSAQASGPEAAATDASAFQVVPTQDLNVAAPPSPDSGSAAPASDPAPAPSVAAPPTKPPAATETAAPALGLSELKQLWQQSIIPAVRERSLPTGSVFTETQVVGLEGDMLTLEFPATASFHLKLATEPKHAGVVGRVLEEVAGRPLRLSCRLAEQPEPIARPPRTDPPEAQAATAPSPGPATDTNASTDAGAAAGADAGTDAGDLEPDLSDIGMDSTTHDPVEDFVTLLKDTFDAQEVDDQ
jgi:DNA polymerase-3 subunit gamma/tau